MEPNVDKIYTLTCAIEALGKTLSIEGHDMSVDIEDTITKLLALIDALGEAELEEVEKHYD